MLDIPQRFMDRFALASLFYVYVIARADGEQARWGAEEEEPVKVLVRAYSLYSDLNRCALPRPRLGRRWLSCPRPTT